ncbi:MAG: DNA repair protein [Chitinophagaceae bacterium]|nr:MAG: DNA repair protein [Chitinophagaceae bacterium]
MEQVKESIDWNMVSEVELIYKSKVKASQRPQVKTVAAVHEFLKANWDENKIELVEQFKVVLLNRAYRVLGLFETSTGGQTGTVADPKMIFTTALKMNANSIILAHNHPSGNLDPSQADKQLTEKIKNAGLFLDITVIDHMILTSESYYSFADEGLL